MYVYVNTMLLPLHFLLAAAINVMVGAHLHIEHHHFKYDRYLVFSLVVSSLAFKLDTTAVFAKLMMVSTRKII